MVTLRGRDEELAQATAALADGASLVVESAPGLGATALLDAATGAAADAAVGATGARRVVVLSTSNEARHIPFAACAGVLACTDVLRGDPADRIEALLRRLGDGGEVPLVRIDRIDLLDDESAVAVGIAVAGGVAVVAASTGRLVDVADATGRWIDGHARVIHLEPLGAEDLAAVAVDELGAPLDPRSAHLLGDAAEGNPALLLALVRHGRRSGALRSVAGSWAWSGPLTSPQAVLDAVIGRIRDLDDPARDVVDLLAVAGRLPVRYLDGLADRVAVGVAGRAGFLRAHADGTVELRRPLDVMAVNDAMAVDRRRSLLRAAADQVACRGGLDPRTTMAYACWLAELGDALHPDVLLAGAEQAFSIGDLATASRLAEDAVRAGAGPVAGRFLDRLRGVAGACACEAESVPDCDERGWFDRAMAAADRFFFGVDDACAARRSISDALEHLGRGRFRDELTGIDLAVRFHSGEPVRSIVVDGCGSIHGGMHPAGVVRASLPVGASLALSGATTDAVELLEEADTLVDGAELSSFIESQVRTTLALALCLDGRIGEARTLAERGHAAAEEVGDPAVIVGWAMVLGHLALRSGRPHEAATSLAEAVTGMGGIDLIGYGAWAQADLALAAAWTDPTSASGPEVVVTPAGSAWVPMITLAAAATEAARGHDGTALLLAETAASRASDLGQSTVEIDALHLVARIKPTRELASRIRRSAQRCQGEALPLAAAGAGALAAGDAADLERTAGRWSDIGMQGMAVEYLSRAADVHEREGRDPSARRCRSEAEALSDRSGARPLVRGTCGGSVPLTTREHEVAVLAAEGLTNHEIAERLHVSVRTVHSHLQAAYRKLGLSDRRLLRARLS